MGAAEIAALLVALAPLFAEAARLIATGTAAERAAVLAAFERIHRETGDALAPLGPELAAAMAAAYADLGRGPADQLPPDVRAEPPKSAPSAAEIADRYHNPVTDRLGHTFSLTEDPPPAHAGPIEGPNPVEPE